jgi:hypothetical protein
VGAGEAPSALDAPAADLSAAELPRPLPRGRQPARVRPPVHVPYEPPRPLDSPELIQEFAERVEGPDGTLYAVRAYGEPRADGYWAGWLVFISVDGHEVLRTERETTQSNREALAYWASGLEATYFEGAFSRAIALGPDAEPSMSLSH